MGVKSNLGALTEIYLITNEPETLIDKYSQSTKILLQTVNQQ
jgi:hypothetical protein